MPVLRCSRLWGTLYLFSTIRYPRNGSQPNLWRPDVPQVVDPQSDRIRIDQGFHNPSHEYPEDITVISQLEHSQNSFDIVVLQDKHSTATSTTDYFAPPGEGDCQSDTGGAQFTMSSELIHMVTLMNFKCKPFDTRIPRNVQISRHSDGKVALDLRNSPLMVRLILRGVELDRRLPRPSELTGCIEYPTSSVAQANLTTKINFNILRYFSSCDWLTIYLHTFLQSLHPFEKYCVQGLPPDFRQNNPTTNTKFRWSFSAMSHQLSFDVAKKGKVRGCQIGE
jgi:hypothetical protein